MLRVGLIGLGKMGLSHYSIVNAQESVEVSAVCDSSRFVLNVLNRYNGVRTYTDYRQMLEAGQLDAVIVSTPTSSHASIVRDCLQNNLHVFCEKPFCLDPEDSTELAALAREKSLINQVGYHNRFVGAFGEARDLVLAGALGRPTHVLAEAYGPVVLRKTGGTWRSKREEGGGALYDYAAHPLDLLTWYFGGPEAVGGAHLNSVFSAETEDEVFATLYWRDGFSGQLSVSWSDESQRKMTTRLTIWGTNGRINVDRQECQAYFRDGSLAPGSYSAGWNVRYTTDLTRPVSYYVRGEEYSAQLAHWTDRIRRSDLTGIGTFDDAATTDACIAAISTASRSEAPRTLVGHEPNETAEEIGWWATVRSRIRSAVARLRGRFTA